MENYMNMLKFKVNKMSDEYTPEMVKEAREILKKAFEEADWEIEFQEDMYDTLDEAWIQDAFLARPKNWKSREQFR